MSVASAFVFIYFYVLIFFLSFISPFFRMSFSPHLFYLLFNRFCSFFPSIPFSALHSDDDELKQQQEELGLPQIGCRWKEQKEAEASPLASVGLVNKELVQSVVPWFHCPNPRCSGPFA
jgi:hypothetical protein